MNVSQRIQHSKRGILRSPMPNEYPVWHTRYIVDVDTESRNDGDWLNLGLVDCNITNDVMQIKRLKNYRVCKFYWWVESVWLLLHKFWSHFGIFGVKYHNEKSHFQTFQHVVLACIHYREGYSRWEWLPVCYRKFLESTWLPL